jgi:hypothetical protein
MFVPIPYDDFRALTWDQRLRIFNALTPDGKAELVRSQVAGWLERHRDELTDAQITFLGEAVHAIVPELYAAVRDPAVMARFKEFERRAHDVLTPQQHFEALTMEWRP